MVQSRDTGDWPIVIERTVRHSRRGGGDGEHGTKSSNTTQDWWKKEIKRRKKKESVHLEKDLVRLDYTLGP